MNKFLSIFFLSWQNEFVYRLNFLLWRLRNILYLMMTYFLWSGVFLVQTKAFGYSRGQMLTYILLLLVMRSIVLASSSADAVGGEIASGELSNYLVKPLGYFKYWFIRDLANKLFNMIFAIVEMFLLWLAFRPALTFPSDIATGIYFVGFAIIAACIFYFMSMAFKFIAFWAPENTWGLTFLMMVLLEVSAGGIFPLDILPQGLQTFLSFTPFPYLVYYPISVYLGKITGNMLIITLIKSFLMLLITYLISRYIWKRGLRNFAAEGL